MRTEDPGGDPEGGAQEGVGEDRAEAEAEEDLRRGGHQVTPQATGVMIPFWRY